ncbi:hypothetical protein K2173_009400 [Erythroxylum novogranatense]|uniref:Polygalacturonase n=1 Tax=Erythroxylum novogranatense TaxID=1862640 RepID=A0AAV8U795_9ROSI|nr:hypothetical protein K2173_009400 [Erythroxylum novogranatense]
MISIASLIKIFMFFALFSSAIAKQGRIRRAGKGVGYNVLKFGARPDGRSDSTKAFMAAWKGACGSKVPATISVPKGRYLLKKIDFVGPCINHDITFHISGTLMAPSDYWILGATEHWIAFQNVVGVTVLGGIINAQGTALWKCKAARKRCPMGTTSLVVTNSKFVVIKGLKSLNSQMFNIVIHRCRNVKLKGVKIFASAKSPNTDGIHVDLSKAVQITNSDIRSGDDCISIGPGSTQVVVDTINCGPGHGISIGSLGQGYHEPGVEGITIKNVRFTNTQNGLRIKTWGRPSKGFVRNVVFQHISMKNVQNPIIIDQMYCPYHQCPHYASGIKISNVKYRDIYGTSATKKAIKLNCSKKYPCTGIQMQNVKLSFRNKRAQASCSSSYGSTSGLVQPPSCLHNLYRANKGNGHRKKGF